MSCDERPVEQTGSSRPKCLGARSDRCPFFEQERSPMPELPAVRSDLRRRSATGVAVAVAVAGVLVAPVDARAASGSGRLPAAASAAPSSAVGQGTGRPVRPAITRAVPPAVARAIARAAAARFARSASTGLASTGLRLVPGTTVSTDLPTRIAVGTSITVVRFTVASPNDYRAPIGVVTLLDNDHLLTQVGVYGTAPGQTTYRGALGMDERTLSTRGTATWILGVFDEADPTGEAGQIAFLDTTVKLRSLLAQSVTRTGDIINLAGATKAYVADEHYAAYPSHRLYLQRWTKTGWATIRDLQTDRLGHVAAQIRIPFRTGLRLWSPDSPTTFGAVTAPTVL